MFLNAVKRRAGSRGRRRRREGSRTWFVSTRLTPSNVSISPPCGHVLVDAHAAGHTEQPYGTWLKSKVQSEPIGYESCVSRRTDRRFSLYGTSLTLSILRMTLCEDEKAESGRASRRRGQDVARRRSGRRMRRRSKRRTTTHAARDVRQVGRIALVDVDDVALHSTKQEDESASLDPQAERVVRALRRALAPLRDGRPE